MPVGFLVLPSVEAVHSGREPVCVSTEPWSWCAPAATLCCVGGASLGGGERCGASLPSGHRRSCTKPIGCLISAEEEVAKTDFGSYPRPPTASCAVTLQLQAEGRIREIAGGAVVFAARTAAPAERRVAADAPFNFSVVVDPETQQIPPRLCYKRRRGATCSTTTAWTNPDLSFCLLSTTEPLVWVSYSGGSQWQQRNPEAKLSSWVHLPPGTLLTATRAPALYRLHSMMQRPRTKLSSKPDGPTASRFDSRPPQRSVGC
jgi:hypothetical protein